MRCGVGKVVFNTGLGFEQVIGSGGGRIRSDKNDPDHHRECAADGEGEEESGRRICGGKEVGAGDRRVEKGAESEAGEDGGHRCASLGGRKALARRFEGSRQACATADSGRDLTQGETRHADQRVESVFPASVHNGESGIAEQEAEGRRREDRFRSAGVDERTEDGTGQVDSSVPCPGDDIQRKRRQVQASTELWQIGADAVRGEAPSVQRSGREGIGWSVHIVGARGQGDYARCDERHVSLLHRCRFGESAPRVRAEEQAMWCPKVKSTDEDDAPGYRSPQS